MTIVVPTIISGGAGSRLWPLSRELHPKPFIRLASGFSLLQTTWQRAAQITGVTDIITVTNSALFFQTRDDYATIAAHIDKTAIHNTFLLEPVGRNTAAAIAAAAHYATQQDEDACLLIMPADHIIDDAVAFSDAVERAVTLAEHGKIVVFGVTPTNADTAYGYIEAADDHTTVQRFIEKPDETTAKQLITTGRHYWNAGMFCCHARTMLNAMQIHCADISDGVKDCLDNAYLATSTNDTQVVLSNDLASVRADSIDYAVMEKAANIAVVPCNIGWQDIGSWHTFSLLADTDDSGNRINGQTNVHNLRLHETKNCYIHSDNGDRLIAAVGINNLTIIDTADALLISDANRTQEVKHVYNSLKALNHDTHKFHRTVHRPWGLYTVLEESTHFKIKRIEVKPGASLSLQIHRHRSEHWIMVDGTATIVNGNDTFIISPNESTYIPAGNRHRLINHGESLAIIIEVQTGEYLSEDDIIRLEDIYGRKLQA